MFKDDGPRDSSLRAADADRESVAEFLREQHVAGRLDTDELQERIDRCYAAKTYAELDAVVADLPVRVQERSESRAREASPSGFALLPLVVILIVVALALSHGHLVWLAVPLAFWFLAGPRRWRGRCFPT